MLKINIENRYYYLLLISFFLHIVASYFNVGFYKLDEHFAILEPVNFKLNQKATLDWDFFIHYDRSWFIPSIYYCITKILIFLKINNPFYWAFAFRLFASLLGWLALICLFYLGLNFLKNKISKNILIYSLTFLWFIPFLHSRTSSENIGSSLIVIGITLFLYLKKSRYLYFYFYLSGLILGFAFLTRYLLGVSILGFGLWALLINRNKFIELIITFLGIISSLFIGVLIDFWGYGIIQFTPLNYYLFNGIDLLINDFLPPISLLILFSILIFWIKSLKHFITWTTLPSFVFLCTVPHKELRYIFPILLFSPIYLSFTYFFLKNFFKKYIQYFILNFFIKFFFYFFVILNIIALLIFLFIPANNDVKFYDFLYSNPNEITKIYTLDDIPYRQTTLMSTFYTNDSIEFTRMYNSYECTEAFFENNKIELNENTNYLNNDEEIEFLEVQQFSTPSWIFKYHLLCNKDKFIQNPITTENKYYIFSDSKYFRFFSEDNKQQCNLIYSTLPIFFLKYNYKNWINRLSHWYVFRC